MNLKANKDKNNYIREYYAPIQENKTKIPPIIEQWRQEWKYWEDLYFTPIENENNENLWDNWDNPENKKVIDDIISSYSFSNEVVK